MRQYIYKPEEIGLSAWPPGELRLEGIETTTDPELADAFVCPGALHRFETPESLDIFPYMKGRESRHVFFHCADHDNLYSKPCLFIRCNTRNWYLDKDPNTISWAWPVEDFAECVDVPAGGFTYDISFQGWLSSDTRIAASKSCQRMTHLRSDIAEYTDFCGYIYYTPEGIRRRAEFRRSMRESRLALCPESIPGVFPYRFFEAMSAGRVPLLVGSDHILPMADKIPYNDFCVFARRSIAREVGEIASGFLKATSDDNLKVMGRLARHYWEKYLNSADWPRTMAAVVAEKVGQLACA